MEGSVIDEIIKQKDSFPKKQRLLCIYIINHYGLSATMTVAELASSAGVGTTTVMRLIQTLGYESYQSFRKALMQAAIVRDSVSYTYIKRSFAQPQATDGTLKSVVETVAGISNALLTQQNAEQFEQAVQVMLGADVIYVLGYRSSSAVAQYFKDSVHLFLRNVVNLSTSQEFLYDNLLHIKKDDVLFVISEWPCTKKTVMFAELCGKRGIPIVLLTNTAANPIMPYTSVAIITNTVDVQAGRLPAMLAAEVLVQDLGRKTAPQSMERLNELEATLKEHGILLWGQEY